VETYLVDQSARASLADWRALTGPLLATATGGRLRQSHLWERVRRLAKAAGIEVWDQLSPHSLRHTGITRALDAGATLRDARRAGLRWPRGPAPPAAMTAPATTWTATPPTPWPSTSPDGQVSMLSLLAAVAVVAGSRRARSVPVALR
jgi:hypothetical protein